MLTQSGSNVGYWLGSIIFAYFFIPWILEVIFGKKWTKKRRERQEVFNKSLRIQYFEEVKAAADNGDPKYAYRLSECYFKGDGVEANNDFGRKWLEIAVQSNYPQAIYDYAKFTYTGMYDYTLNIDFAFEQFLMASTLGVKEAKYDIEEMKNKYKLQNSDKYLKYLMNIDDTGLTGIKKFMEQCESEPEQLLLMALINRGGLKAKSKNLEGQIRLQPQVKIGQYRVDFLVNDWLAVEVDGKKFHHNEKSFVDDRIRDQILLKQGITTFRTAASQVYKNPSAVASDIIKIVKSKN